MTKRQIAALAAAMILAGALPAAAETKPIREPTAGQIEARGRQKQCGAEWKAQKAAKTLAGTVTWPQYWSACNTRLKGKPADEAV